MKRTLLSLFCLLCFICSCNSLNAQSNKKPVIWAIEDNPKLPRVLLIGDSISQGYTFEVRRLLAGKANVHRPLISPTKPDSAQSTNRGLKHIDKWLGEEKWDVIYFNWGLWDIKYVNENQKPVDLENGRPISTIEQYTKNLEKLIKRMKKTGATLIFATTTPVPEGSFARKSGDATRYNGPAKELMEQYDIPRDGLYTLALRHQKDIQRPNNVHFTKKGYKVLGEHVASVILEALENKTPPMDIFKKAYWPGDSINDHSFIYDKGKWHLFHIWIVEYGTAKDSVIGHATSTDLFNWKTEPNILPKSPAPSWEHMRGGNAPYVIKWKDTYYIFYSRYSRAEDGVEYQQIGLATSKDLYNWTPHEKNPVFHPSPKWSPWADKKSNQYRPQCCRDPHVIRYDGKFILYYVAMTKKDRVCAVGHAVSDDLINWQDRGPVATMPVIDGRTAMVESPGVIFHDGKWYLFITYSNATRYAVSDNPYEFKDFKIISRAHASEVFEWNKKMVHLPLWHWRP